MSLPSPTELPRSPGRPRDARVDAAIVAATLELAGTVGLGALTMDAVAARAGVSKATIYRRWSSKEALVLDAWMACFEDEPLPDTDSLRGDLLALTQRLTSSVSSGVLAQVLPQMVAAARVNPDLAEVYRLYVAQRRRRATAVLERAVERGEVAADVDLDVVQDLVSGPLFYRALMTGEPVDDAYVEQIVDVVLRGVGAKSVRPTPAR
jgi:AcrR family transcriptional regulator